MAKRSLRRRTERVVLGMVFTFVAFLLERRVLKAIRKRGEAPPKRPSIADGSVGELEQKPSAT